MRTQGPGMLSEPDSSIICDDCPPRVKGAQLVSALNYLLIADPSDAREIGENFLTDKFVWNDFSVLALDCGVLNDLESILTGSASKGNDSARRCSSSTLRARSG